MTVPATTSPDSITSPDGITSPGDNPRVTLTTRHPYGTPGPCLHCGHPVDTEDGYLTLHTGTLRQAILVAVAHPSTFNEADDDWDDSCTQALRRLWERLLRQVGAGVLRHGADGGGDRWYLGGEALHAGTPIEILDHDGTWRPGCYEYTLTATGSVPKLYLPLGGWDSPQGAMTIPEGAAVRIPDHRRW